MSLERNTPQELIEQRLRRTGDSQKRLYLHKGSYQDIQKIVSANEVLQKGKGFRFSEFAKPYLSNESYQEMEDNYNKKIPSFPAFGPLPDIPDEGKDKGKLPEEVIYRKPKTHIIDCSCRGGHLIVTQAAGEQPIDFGWYSGKGENMVINKNCEDYFRNGILLSACWGLNPFTWEIIRGKGNLMAMNAPAGSLDCCSMALFKPECSSESVVISVTSGDGCKGSISINATPCGSSDTPIEGPDTMTKSSTQAYSYACKDANKVTWSVSNGSHFAITQGGVVTSDSGACGSFTITAECKDCGTKKTKIVRVSNAGTWTLRETRAPAAGQCCCCNGATGCTGTNCTCLCCGSAAAVCTTIADNWKTEDTFLKVCTDNSNPSCHLSSLTGCVSSYAGACAAALALTVLPTCSSCQYVIQVANKYEWTC